MFKRFTQKQTFKLLPEDFPGFIFVGSYINFTNTIFSFLAKSERSHYVTTSLCYIFVINNTKNKVERSVGNADEG